MKTCEHPTCSKEALRDTVILVKRTDDGKFRNYITADCVRHSEKRLKKEWTGVSIDRSTGQVLAATEFHYRKRGESFVDMPVSRGVRVIRTARRRESRRQGRW